MTTPYIQKLKFFKERLESIQFSIAQNQDLTAAILKKREKNLDELWGQTTEYFAGITLSEDNNAKKPNVKQQFQDCERLYYQLSGEIVEQICRVETAAAQLSLQSPLSSTIITEPRHRPNIRLPELDVPVFSGKYEDWPSFRDMFMNVIIKTSIAPAEKLFYLRKFLNPEVRKDIEKFDFVDTNFPLAWKVLTDKFENKRKLINAELQKMFSLYKANEESSDQLKSISETVDRALSSIKNLGIDIENWDALIVFLITQKLPRETHLLWEQSLSDPTEIPKLSDLLQFLRSRQLALEAVPQPKWNKNSYSSNTSNQPPKRHFQSFHSNSNQQQNLWSCKICNNKHPLKYCPEFLKMSVSDRQKVVKSNKFCLKCLALSHTLENCFSKSKCEVCGLKHHTLLHYSNNKNDPNIKTYHTDTQTQSSIAHSNQKTNNNQSNQSNQSHAQTSNSSNKEKKSRKNRSKQRANQSIDENTPTLQSHTTSILNSNKLILLATAQVIIINNNQHYKARALIDPASQGSFILDSLVTKLNLQTRRISASVSGVGNEISISSNRKVTMSISSSVHPQFKIPVEAISLKNLTGVLPVNNVNIYNLQFLDNLQLADPEFHTPGPIELLLGSDVYPHIISNGVKKGNMGHSVAQNTIFGWIISGAVEQIVENPNRNIVAMHSNITTDELLQRFWELEEVEYSKPYTEDEQACEDIYIQTHKRNQDGSYVVNLPFKNNQFLDASRDKAIKIFLQNEKRLLANPTLKNEYNKIMKEYLDAGQMIPCSSSEIVSHAKILNQIIPQYKSNYLPHHAVIKPEAVSTKVRIVFNASSPTRNRMSLNDCLHVGPTLQQDLMMLILQWRKFKFVCTADIKMMYRKIWLNPEQTDFQRIVYRFDTNDKIQDYKLLTVTFGVNCAPYLAIRTLNQLAIDDGKNYTEAARIVNNNVYVDDAFFGGDTIDQCLFRQTDLINLLQKGNFELRKWAANHPDLLQKIPVEHQVNENFLLFDDNAQVKALGITWNAKIDNFTYKINFNENENEILTKRKILSAIAKLFDPAGWISPILLPAKLLMQELWKQNSADSIIKWDTPVPENLAKSWMSFYVDIQHVSEIKIPRYIGYTSNVRVEIHGFCDSSERAYAAAIYLKIINSSNIVTTNLMTSKSKLAPLRKMISLPRLELCGAVLLSKLLKKFIKTLNLESYPVYTWTDSTIVISWLHALPFVWKTFVANRVSEVLDNIGNRKWYHVPSAKNPADLATRGCEVMALKNSKLWWNGPDFLHQPIIDFPSNFEPNPTIQEDRKIITKTFVTIFSEEIFSKFSSFNRAVRVMAYCIRFVDNTQKIKISSSIILQNKEIELARKYWIFITQQLYFGAEINNLIYNDEIDHKSKILSLRPQLDHDGILRVGGRLEHSLLDFEEKHPIIIPHNSHLAKLLLRHIHYMTGHGGLQLMLNVLRRNYWITGAKRAIKTIIHQCTTCFKYKSQAQVQLMGSLPYTRTLITRPFSNCGMDFGGPIYVKSSTLRNAKIEKAYFCLFICFSTRAIHLEAVSSLSSEAFLLAFKRFIARRGLCKNCYSDNGLNFVGASRILQTEFEQAIKHATQLAAEHYADKGINWHFIPPEGPEMGGFWEAGIKSTKHHLRRMMQNQILTFEQLSTLLAQIEAILNSRPLTPLLDDPEDLQVLTPGHFLIGDTLLSPPVNNTDSDKNINNKFKLIEQIRRNFWKVWSADYLNRLQHRPKWRKVVENVKIGDMVLLTKENIAPNHWPLGRIVDVKPGKDGLVRVVSVKTTNGTYDRRISKVRILPFAKNEISSETQTNNN